MALTLAQAELYSTNLVYRGVIDEFYRSSPIFPHLEFIEIEGNAYQYLRESTRATVAFRDPQETWTESTGTQTQITAVLRILGGDADIDNFLKVTRSNYTDLENELIMGKVRDTKWAFLDAFYYGDNTVNAKEFSGLHALTTAGQTVEEGSGGAAGTWNVSNLDLLIDTIVDGPPDLLVCSKASRRLLNAYVRANGTYTMDRDEWGNTIQTYNGVPVYVDDSIVNTESISGTSYSAKTGGTNSSSMFAVQFGPTGVFGLQNSGSISVKKIREEMEDKDGARWRVKWYTGLALGSTVKLAKITGIATTTAMVS